MKPAPFTYHRPTSVSEAVERLRESNEDSEVLAGGQSLIPMMNFRRKKPQTLVDINRVDGLSYIRDEGKEIAIGAMTRQSDIAAAELVGEGCPLIREALSYVGHKPTRHRGTIGGNMANADPASELPAVAVVQDATFVVRGIDGERELSAEEFFRGKMRTAIGDDELLTEVRIPMLDDGDGYAFTEQRPRNHGWAITGVAATLSVADGVVENCRLVYTGVDDRPLRITDAEECVIGAVPDEAAFASAATVARGQVDPPSADEVTPDDLKNNQRTGPTEHPHASQHAPPEFRRQLVETLTKRVLAEAAERAEGL